VELILDLSMPVRLAILFVVGVLMGASANVGIYRLAFMYRAIDPWLRKHEEASPRRPLDRLPIIGWFSLRRESTIFGTAHWIRPMVLEILCGVGLALLYWWQIGETSLWQGAVGTLGFSEEMAIRHQQFLMQAILIWFLLIATMIDIDEMYIPDAITIPGTLIALLLAALLPACRLPEMSDRWDPILHAVVPPATYQSMNIVSPRDWPAVFFEGWTLAVGIACFCLWCVAIMPRTWYNRHGIVRAIQLCIARLKREGQTYLLLVIGVVGSALLYIPWKIGGQVWESTFSALIGMAVGGGIIWAVRIVAEIVMQREAMGFGDVTLMAMIGAMLGWQATIIIFFLAPLAGAVVGILYKVFKKESEIPYGPFLSVGTVMMLLFWRPIWDRVSVIFGIGLLVPITMGVCILLLGLLLGLWQAIRKLITK